ncbi:hypothetical protein [Chitinimonas koreensis]|uniref:hypothetical protein n=1 Tax=Chitinimonas koreensis TaxID=356302 RepID=UPI000415F360|nr:hypothetical protein [Chitinimonas koreensis]QNM96568.1 hypothetical protein H9L41_22870 [Chitinimonas koreensis]
MRRWLAWIVTSAAAVLAALAAYSLATTAWYQWRYGGDALGPAGSRMAVQAGLLLAALAAVRLLRHWRRR